MKIPGISNLTALWKTYQIRRAGKLTLRQQQAEMARFVQTELGGTYPQTPLKPLSQMSITDMAHCLPFNIYTK